jgi:tetratricopeptide (TPR) repeat protein
VSENANDSGEMPRSFEVTHTIPEDEVESARILMREGLAEEAKKTLYRLLAHQPQFSPALKLLKQIQDVELKALFEPDRRMAGPRKKPTPRYEPPEQVIEKLERDLQLDPEMEVQGDAERWVVSQEVPHRERVDLAVAFFEMGCFADALRELTKVEKQIRVEKTFLGEEGVAVVAMIAQCLVQLNRAFEAKSKLEPILTETDLRHEDKLTLYYCMGLAEQALGHSEIALGWYQKISESDLDFRDVRVRIKLMT